MHMQTKWASESNQLPQSINPMWASQRQESTPLEIYDRLEIYNYNFLTDKSPIIENRGERERECESLQLDLSHVRMSRWYKEETMPNRLESTCKQPHTKSHSKVGFWKHKSSRWIQCEVPQPVQEIKYRSIIMIASLICKIHTNNTCWPFNKFEYTPHSKPHLQGEKSGWYKRKRQYQICDVYPILQQCATSHKFRKE